MAEDSFWESDDAMSEEEANQIMESESEAQAEDVEAISEEEVAEEESSEEQDLEADAQILKDASLRLEQGNLYKMLLKHDLFEGVEADARAIANVQRELRSFIRERLEVLVGLKADPRIAPKKVQVELPFTELEIQLLKEFLGKVTGKTETKPAAMKPATVQVSSAPVKIKPVVGTSSSKVTVSAPKKAQPKPKQAPTKTEEPRLQKPPSEMTAAELIEYNKKVVAARQQGRKAIAARKMPMPDADQLQNMYATRVQTNGGGNLIGAILTKMGKGAPGLIEAADGGYEDSNDGRM